MYSTISIEDLYLQPQQVPNHINKNPITVEGHVLNIMHFIIGKTFLPAVYLRLQVYDGKWTWRRLIS